MKILHIEAGKNLCSGALQVFYLLEGLSRLKENEAINNILICPLDCELAERANRFATVYAMEMKGNIDFGLKKRIQRVIHKEKPDLVHIHSRVGTDIWGTWAAKSEGVPVVCTRRVDNPEPRWLAGLKYRQFNKVITISKGIRQVLLSEGVPADHVTCVHSAVNTDLYNLNTDESDKASFYREFALPDNKLVIANFAQMIEQKGQGLLIEAFSRLVDDFPNAHLMLFGMGSKLSRYKELVAEKGLTSKVTFSGFRKDNEKILPFVDIVAHPASMEGLGVALLQSAACCKPIAATRAGGIPEVVEDGYNGYLMEIGDLEELTHCLQQLLWDDSLRRKLGLAGREKMLREFSIDAMTCGHYQVYREVLGR